MKVTAWHGGTWTYGIRIGKANRKLYFKPVWESVTIEIGGKEHRFALTPGFWRECPEIRDSGEPVLRRWLESHFSVPWPTGNPPHMQLVPAGDRRFRLVP